MRRWGAIASLAAVLVTTPALADEAGETMTWLRYTDADGHLSVIGPRADGPMRGRWFYAYAAADEAEAAPNEIGGIHDGQVGSLQDAVEDLRAQGRAVPWDASRDPGEGHFEVRGKAGGGRGPERRFRVPRGPALERFDALLRDFRHGVQARVERTRFEVVRVDSPDGHRWALQGFDQRWPIAPLRKQSPDDPDPRWETTVNAVRVEASGWLVHLFSYELQGKFAVGYDRFLVIRPGSSWVSEVVPSGAPTIDRGIYQGCRSARQHEYVLADVDGDGFLDLGTRRRSLRCPDEGGRVVLEEGPIAWRIRDAHETWPADPAFEGQRPEGSVRLPWIALEQGPVDMLLEISRSQGP